MKEKKEKNIQILAKNFINNPCGETFGPLMERLNWGLRKHVYKIVQDNEVTDEVVLKTFEDIWVKYTQFDINRGQFSSWAYSIAKNNALMYIQKQKSLNKGRVNADLADLYDSSYNLDKGEDSLSTKTSDGGFDEKQCSYIEDMDGFYNDEGKFVRIDRSTIIDQMADASLKCIEYLPDHYRLVLTEQLVNKKKISEIADDNQMPTTTIVNWLYKGRTKLQEIVKDKYKDLYESYRMYYPASV